MIQVSRRPFVLLITGLLSLAPVWWVRGEDSDEFRPYVHLRSGEFDTVWGVQDMWAFGVGANFNRHLGLELAFDSYEKDFDPFGTKIGEQSLLSLVPQLRLRLPVAHDRITPYVLLGAGLGWYDFNDPTQNGFGLNVDAQGNTLVIAAGVGVDFFLRDEIAFNLEAKYLWMDTLGVSVNGQSGTFEMSDFVGTFGFRAFLSSNNPRLMAEMEEDVPARFYFGANFGGAWIADGNLGGGVHLVPESASVGTIGQSVGLSLGMNLGTHFAVELPVDYFEGVIYLDNVAGVNGGVGEYSNYAFLPSLRFRWPLRDGRLIPYAIAGAGGVYGEVNDRFQNGSGVKVDSKGFAPSFGLGAGVEYFCNRNVSLSGQVKWNYTWDRQVSVAGTEYQGDLSLIHFQIGVRLYLFDVGGSKE